MDHAFRMVIFMEALTVAKRMFSDDSSNRTVASTLQARHAIADAIEELRSAIQVDVNAII